MYVYYAKEKRYILLISHSYSITIVFNILFTKDSWYLKHTITIKHNVIIAYMYVTVKVIQYRYNIIYNRYIMRLFVLLLNIRYRYLLILKIKIDHIKFC